MQQVRAGRSDPTTRPTTQQARRWLAARPVFLDTETTGLDAAAEICEIALVNHAGTILLDTLVRPRRPIPPEATAVHGIADADVAGAPSLPDIWEDLVFLVTINAVVIYNGAYDIRLLRQSAHAWNLAVPDLRAGCAMLLYAEHCGEWSDYHGGYRWHKLSEAARQCALPIPMNLHRAAADAELTRLLVQHMAREV